MRAALFPLLIAVSWIVAEAPAIACTFCADSLARRDPLAKHYSDSGLVVYGKLQNPRPAADGIGGTTELQVANVLKADKALAGTRVVVIPRYIPLVGDTPREYVLFCSVSEGKIDPIHGVSAGPAAAKYLAAAAALDRTDPIKVLGFFFKYLDAADPAIAADAFLEFARASDRDIQKAAAVLDRKKLRSWLADPKVPAERLGVYGMMLGLCGNRDDAAWLARELSRDPLPERISSALGGLVAGLTLLDAAAGWTVIDTVLTGAERSFTDKLAVIGTLRYLQATRWADSKARILASYTTLIRAGDFADLAVDDLRRWACWDLTATILAQFGQPTHKAPAAQRGIVRYALACPDEAAKSFIAGVRTSDPDLVRKVEEANKLYEVVPVSNPKR